MRINKDYPEQHWISLILRAAMSLLFAMAALGKFLGGLGVTAEHFQAMFKETWLPLWLVTPYAYAIAFMEALIAIWLLSGIKLKEGWIFTVLVLLSLAFGLMAALKPATDIYTYILIACVGIYVSRYDSCAMGKK